MPVKTKPSETFSGRIDLRMAFEHASEGRGTLRGVMAHSHLFGNGDGPSNIAAAHASVRVLKAGASETLDFSEIVAGEKDMHGQPAIFKDITSFGIQVDASREKDKVAKLVAEVGESRMAVRSGGWQAGWIPQGEPPLLKITNVGEVDAEFSILIAGH